MAAKGSDIKVLTANRLGDGRVVYLGEGGWTTRLDAAQVLRGPDEFTRAEEAGALADEQREVVEPYLIDVEIIEDGIQPARLKERIRADGPTTGNSIQYNTLAEAS